MPDLRARLCVACAALAVAATGCKPERLPGEQSVEVVLSAAADPDEQAEAAATGPVLLNIGGYDFTVGEFERRAASISEVGQRRLNSVQGRSTLVEMLVWMELLSHSAEEEGWAGEAEEALLLDEARTLAAIDAHAAGTVNRAELDDHLADYYEQRRTDFVMPEERRLYGFVVDDPALAAELHGVIEAAVVHSRPSQVFLRLARLYSSHEGSRSEDGRWGWIVANADGGHNDVALDEAVFAMEEPGLGPVVASTRGWELFYLAGIRPARDLGLDEVRGYLSEEQYLRAVGSDHRERLDRAREEAGVSIDGGVIERLAAARANEPDAPSRPRRYALEALAKEPGAELGDVVARELAETVETPFANPMTTPAAAPPTPADGSGAPETTAQ